MAEPVKFTFNKNFDGGKKLKQEEDLAEMERRIEAVSAESYAKGLEDGKAQTLEGIENHISSVLSDVERVAGELFAERAALEEKIQKDASQLAMAISSKLAPALVRHNPYGEIDALVADCFAVFKDEPRLSLRVNDTLAEEMETRLDHLRIAAGFTGEVMIIPDQTISVGDCRMEWPDGGAERNIGDVMEKVEEAVERFLKDDRDDADAG